MQLTDYFSLTGEQLRFSKQQGSDFAKDVAGDFNPLHNTHSSRFCVPGDLLFAVFLYRYGISQSMTFEFSGMVNDNTTLVTPKKIDPHFTLRDNEEKAYLSVERSGDINQSAQFINDLTVEYVKFSGRTFPHILVDLMKNNNVMINTDRPLVIYKSMHIELDTLVGDNLSLSPSGAILQSNGKKGEATLQFMINAGGTVIGHGEKVMLLSGLRDYDQSKIDGIVNAYAQWKADYLMA